jgi:hypothetical protein
MKVLLIKPPVRDFYDTDVRLQPIGLAYLFAYEPCTYAFLSRNSLATPKNSRACPINRLASSFVKSESML